MAKIEKATPVAEYRHRTSIGENGQVLYDAPVQIRDQADLNNYRITKEDCQTLSFGSNVKIKVYFLQVENRELAEFLWASLSTEHTRQYTERRCFVPGKKNTWIRCPRSTSCENCPYWDEKKTPIISLNGLEEVNYHPEVSKSAEEVALGRLQYLEIRNLLDEEDDRLAGMIEAMVLQDESVKAIAERFGIQASRVYQLLAKIRKIGEAYKNK